MKKSPWHQSEQQATNIIGGTMSGGGSLLILGGLGSGKGPPPPPPQRIQHIERNEDDKYLASHGGATNNAEMHNNNFSAVETETDNNIEYAPLGASLLHDTEAGEGHGGSTMSMGGPEGSASSALPGEQEATGTNIIGLLPSGVFRHNNIKAEAGASSSETTRRMGGPNWAETHALSGAQAVTDTYNIGLLPSGISRHYNDKAEAGASHSETTLSLDGQIGASGHAPSDAQQPATDTMTTGLWPSGLFRHGKEEAGVSAGEATFTAKEILWSSAPFFSTAHVGYDTCQLGAGPPVGKPGGLVLCTLPDGVATELSTAVAPTANTGTYFGGGSGVEGEDKEPDGDTMRGCRLPVSSLPPPQPLPPVAPEPEPNKRAIFRGNHHAPSASCMPSSAPSAGAPVSDPIMGKVAGSS